jgi:hypothetical protein
MRLTESDLRKIVQQSPPQSACLDEELILRGGRGDLSESEVEMVADHVGSCQRCAAAYQAAFAMRELGGPRASTPRWMLFAAAALLVALFGGMIGAWITAQRFERPVLPIEATPNAERTAPVPAVAAASRPPARIDMPIIDLDPGVTRGAAEPLIDVEPSPASDLFTLILHFDEFQVGTPVVEISNEEGKIVWRDTWTPAKPAALLVLTLDRSHFPPGEYTVRVEQVRFRVRVRQP